MAFADSLLQLSTRSKLLLLRDYKLQNFDFVNTYCKHFTQDKKIIEILITYIF